jgi:hypothetical protein
MTGGPHLSSAARAGGASGLAAVVGAGKAELVGYSWAGGAGLHWRKRAVADIWRGAGRLQAAGPQAKMGQKGGGQGRRETKV